MTALEKGLRDQVCARLLGYRAFEAISFDEYTPQPSTEFTFEKIYGAGDEVDLTSIVSDEVDDTKSYPYPAHADYLNYYEPITTKMPASALMLSILPVLFDDRTPWRPDMGGVFDIGIEHHKPKYPGENAPCYFEYKERDDVYPGYMEMLKLLSDTGVGPENLVGVVNAEKEDMWVNQHFKASLEQLNAEVKETFDKHLERVSKVQREGYGESAPYKLSKR